MKTQIIKPAETKKPEFHVGGKIVFQYWVPLQNIGWGTERKTGAIQKVNRVTLHVLDNENNVWRVNKVDVVEVL
jgi:hypothetical protein